MAERNVGNKWGTRMSVKVVEHKIRGGAWLWAVNYVTDEAQVETTSE